MILQGAEVYFFWALALIALMSGLFTVLARSAVHSAICLMMTLIAVAGLFLLMQAEFVMGVQILVYVGGVMVLFLFVIMLVNVREERLDKARLFSRQWLGAVVLAGALAVVFSYAIRTSDPYRTIQPEQRSSTPPAALERNPQGATPISKNTQQVGMALYQQGALPFEIASILLLVAIIGSVLLARTPRQERLYDQEQETP